jgi:8-hydroxy-5-deazaflavin:NADPH oxidoreductase
LTANGEGREGHVNVTIIGTGNMARGLATRFVAGGHQVTVLGKDEAGAQAVADDVGSGNVRTGVSTGPVEGDVVVLAVYYPDARAAATQHADTLAGKVVVDITNPLNATYDGLVTPPDGSATQELAALAPQARLVKAFNTTFAGTLREGTVEGRPLDVFIAGDDEDANRTVANLVESAGLRPIDVGPLGRARELEALGLLHITLQGTLGTGGGSALKILP